jgi:hypothetical protein
VRVRVTTGVGVKAKAIVGMTVRVREGHSKVPEQLYHM